MVAAGDPSCRRGRAVARLRATGPAGLSVVALRPSSQAGSGSLRGGRRESGRTSGALGWCARRSMLGREAQFGAVGGGLLGGPSSRAVGGVKGMRRVDDGFI